MGFECMRCGKPISEGEVYWSVDVNHEVADRGVITVLEGVSYRVFCDPCGAELDYPGMQIPPAGPGLSAVSLPRFNLN